MINVVIGSNSKIYQSIARAGDIHLSSGRNRRADLQYLAKNTDSSAMLRLINCAAPTTHAANCALSRAGVEANYALLRGIVERFNVQEIVQLGSAAEFVMKFDVFARKTPVFSKRPELSLDLLTERPYTYWKIFQYNYISKLCIQNRVSFRVVTIPFVDFQNFDSNKSYYFPDNKPIFSPSSAFTSISSSDLSKAVYDNQPLTTTKITINKIAKSGSQSFKVHTFHAVLKYMIYILFLLLARKNVRRDKVLNAFSMLNY